MPKTKRKTKARAAKKSRRPSASYKLKKTVPRKTSRKPELKYIAWQTVQLEDLTPFLQRQFVVGDDIMVARILMKKGCIIPLHSHHNEQFSYIIEGALK